MAVRAITSRNTFVSTTTPPNSEGDVMVLTRKTTGVAQNGSTQSRLTRPVSGMIGRTIDRRAFLRRSGIALGAGAVASQLPFNIVGEATAAEKAAEGKLETKRTVCTHCSVG